MNYLDCPVTMLRGVGQNRAEQLKKLQIETVRDLIRHFPRTYCDYSQFTPIAQLTEGVPASVYCKVLVTPAEQQSKRSRVNYAAVSVIDRERTGMTFLLYNQPYVVKQLKQGLDIVVYGKPERTGLSWTMTNVQVRFDTRPAIEPIYALTEGLNSHTIARLIRQALDLCENELKELLLPAVRREHDLPPLADAYRMIHFPKKREDAEKARRRFAFDELFLYIVGIRILKKQREKKDAPVLKPVDLSPFYAQLPYELTGSQKRVIDECTADLRRSVPMSRLVQGDVGSGKTAIAAALAYLAAKNGGQTALLVPTEILAFQHQKSLKEMLEPLGLRVEVICAGMRPTERRNLLLELHAGSIDVLVGTHALLNENVLFSNLVLAITDEQHRFGVQQRAKLAQKGTDPHLLFLSATPIPRSLSLILYGDLDLSILNELPPGRKRVKTFLLDEDERQRLYGYLGDCANKGLQTYVVCPKIESDESNDSVEETVEFLRQRLPDVSVAGLHGKLSSAEKEELLQAFSENRISVLVSTTVIEVGVNVPNAVNMVIMGADRFGLSQLHQLRGRVGRGSEQAYCFLISDSEDARENERLKALCDTNDGFEISRRDLELRGPGDALGDKQHGLPPFKMASQLPDMSLVEEVSRTAKALFDNPSWFILPENRELFIAATEFLRSSETLQ